MAKNEQDLSVAWRDIFSLQEQLNEFVSCQGLFRIIESPHIYIINTKRDFYKGSIFRVITLTNRESAYRFYGAGYNRNIGYFCDKWMFDIDLQESVLQEGNYLSKKSVISAIKRDVSQIEKRLARNSKRNFYFNFLYGNYKNEMEEDYDITL